MAIEATEVPSTNSLPPKIKRWPGGAQCENNRSAIMSLITICLWSGPRNVSTALMYSFRARGDATVVDEPLYAHYLRASGAMHPGRDEVLASMDPDGDRVIRTLLAAPRLPSRPVLFLKQMAHHCKGVDRSFLATVRSAFLIRDPRKMLPSLARQIEEPVLRDTGLADQCLLLEELQRRGQRPPIVDSDDLLKNPASVLSQLCARLDIHYDPAMLAWPPGPKPEDGIWAKHWYHNVHRSTRFATPNRMDGAPLKKSLELLLAECAPYYERLIAGAIAAE